MLLVRRWRRQWSKLRRVCREMTAYSFPTQLSPQNQAKAWSMSETIEFFNPNPRRKKHPKHFEANEALLRAFERKHGIHKTRMKCGVCQQELRQTAEGEGIPNPCWHCPKDSGTHYFALDLGNQESIYYGDYENQERKLHVSTYYKPYALNDIAVATTNIRISNQYGSWLFDVDCDPLPVKWHSPSFFTPEKLDMLMNFQ
jgi:hypothetical protein